MSPGGPRSPVRHVERLSDALRTKVAFLASASENAGRAFLGRKVELADALGRQLGRGEVAVKPGSGPTRSLPFHIQSFSVGARGAGLAVKALGVCWQTEGEHVVPEIRDLLRSIVTISGITLPAVFDLIEDDDDDSEDDDEA